MSSSLLIFDTTVDDFKGNFVGSDPRINYTELFKLFIRYQLQINNYIVIHYTYYIPIIFGN